MPARSPVVEVALRVRHPSSHLVEVTLRLPPTHEPMVRHLRMPRWVPGSYSIRDFGRHVQDLEVHALPGGDAAPRALPTRRERTDSWTFDAPGDTPVELTYKVYARDLSVQSSHITHDHATLIAAQTILWDEHVRDLAWRLTLDVPDGWRIWSGLPIEGPKKGAVAPGRWPPERKGHAVFLADGYDHLVDCPIETGDAHHEVRFLAAGKPHRLVVWQPPNGTDWDKVHDDLKRLVEEAAALFGGLPYKDYTFIAQCAPGHGGGLEHRNSTLLGVEPLHLVDKKEYQRRWLPLCAHEFFHTWTVKRIIPAAFLRYDYQQEVVTGLLWLFEGATSYYETPLLNRAGLLDDDHKYHDLQELVKFLDTTPGRFRLAVVEASRLSWTKLYRRHESNINTNVSYYSKGALVCLCIDAHLRERGSSLDDVFRYLWKEHGRKGLGVDEDSIPAIIKQATGVDMRRQLTQWIDRPGDLPLEKACRTLGLRLERKHSDDDATKGFGVHLQDDEPTRIVISAVSDRWEGKDEPDDAEDPDVPALAPGDEVIAIDGWRVTKGSLGNVVSAQSPDRPVPVTVFREGRLVTLEVPLVDKQKDKVKIKANKKASAAQKRRRTSWERSLVKKPKTGA